MSSTMDAAATKEHHRFTVILSIDASKQAEDAVQRKLQFNTRISSASRSSSVTNYITPN